MLCPRLLYGTSDKGGLCQALGAPAPPGPPPRHTPFMMPTLPKKREECNTGSTFLQSRKRIATLDVGTHYCRTSLAGPFETGRSV